MAVVRFGNGVADLRGSIDGTTFSRSRSGAVARGRTVPINPRTTFQQESRNRFASVLEIWRNSSRGDVIAWNEWASTQTRLNKLGQPYTPSGQQLFLELNNNRQSVGLPFLSSPPYTAVAPALASLTVAAEYAPLTSILDKLEVTGELADSGSSAKINIWATPPHLPSLTNVSRILRLVTFADADAPADLFANYNLRFGSPVIPDGSLITVMIQAIATDSGLASPTLTETTKPTEST